MVITLWRRDHVISWLDIGTVLRLPSLRHLGLGRPCSVVPTSSGPLPQGPRPSLLHVTNYTSTLLLLSVSGVVATGRRTTPTVPNVVTLISGSLERSSSTYFASSFACGVVTKIPLIPRGAIRTLTQLLTLHGQAHPGHRTRTFSEFNLWPSSQCHFWLTAFQLP